MLNSRPREKKVPLVLLVDLEEEIAAEEEVDIPPEKTNMLQEKILHILASVVEEDIKEEAVVVVIVVVEVLPQVLREKFKIAPRIIMITPNMLNALHLAAEEISVVVVEDPLVLLKIITIEFHLPRLCLLPICLTS
jgi:hypothetical protein